MRTRCPRSQGAARLLYVRSHDDEFVLTGHRPPDFAGATEDLADVGVGLRVGEAGEFLGGRVEADEGVGAEVAQPDDVLVVDVDGVGLGTGAGELPLLPASGRGVVAPDLSGVPFAHPDVPG